MRKIGKCIIIIFVVSLMAFSRIYAESRPPARGIPDKTLVVGTHLISLDALNAEILKIAAASAQKIGQNNVYFKSDINKGAWYDITDGGNITRIAISTDNLVTEEIIDALTLTHYTKPNGQTVEFESGKTVSVNNIEGINFPPNLPELEEVVKEAETLSQILAELDEDDESRAIYERALSSATWVLQLINDSVFKEYSEQLDSFNSFILFLRNEKKAVTAVVELAVAEKMYISAARELYIYGIVEGKINKQFDDLNYLEQQALINKYSSALTNMKAHMLELAASLKGEPANSLEKVYQKYSGQMLSFVFTRNNESAYTCLLKLNALNNLRTEVIEDKPLEIEMAREVKKDVLQKLYGEIGSGGGSEYKRAARNGERRDILEKLRQDNAALFTLYTDELNAASNYIVIRTDSPQGKAREAAETAEAYSSLLDSAQDTELNGLLSASLSKELISAEENAKELKLAASEEYSAAKGEVARLEGEAKSLNEKYLGSIEENDGGAEGYKNLRDEALESLLAAEGQLAEIAARVLAREDFAVDTGVFSGLEGDSERAGALRDRLAGLVVGDSGEALAEIIEEINNLVDGGLGAEASAQEASEALNILAVSLSQRDFEGQARSLINALNNAAAKIYASQKLRANERINALGANLDEMIDNAQGLINAGLTQQSGEKLIEMKAAFEDLGEKLTSAAEEALREPVPPVPAARLAAPQSGAGEPNLIFKDYTVNLSSPIIISGKEILVPAEELARQMGASFIRDRSAGRLVVKDKGVLIEFIENDKFIYINDRREAFNPSAQSVNGIIYIPLSCIEKAYRLIRAEENGNIILTKR